MARTQQQQTVYDTIVRQQVAYYSQKGYSNIKADLPNFPNGAPNVVNGRRPDVSAIMNGTTVIAEIETSDSIYWPETMDQWRDFDRSGYPFHVVVPQSCLNEAQRQALNNSITVDHWIYVENY